MSAPASFQVKIINNIIHVKLEGVWDMATDIEYLHELSQAMRQCHNKPWALVVDMRGWIVSKEIQNFKSKINLQMDRRNQSLECWLVDDINQGGHVAHFVKRAGFPFKRFLDDDSANEWLSQQGFSLSDVEVQ